METLTVLKFWAPWCGPCQTMTPLVKEAVNSFDNFVLKSVNVDEDSDLAVKYEVRGIPTLVVLKSDEVVGKLVGARSIEDLKEFFQDCIK